MFLRRSRNISWALIMLLVCWLWPQVTEGLGASAQRSPQQSLQGRVVAKVARFIPGMLDWKWQTFLFQAESRGPGSHVRLLIVEYEYTDAEGPLPESFFNYSRIYRIKVRRDRDCDEDLATLSKPRGYQHRDGPLRGMDLLEVLKGVPAGALDDKGKLACFVLRPGAYRVLPE